MNILSRLATFGLLLLACGTAMADDFGYCTGNIERTHIFRVGSTTKQGLAIRIGREKLALLKGRTVSSVSAAFGSKRMENGAVFLSTSLDAEPLRSQNVTVTAVTKWVTFGLQQAYTITGDEPCLYIGYTGEISANASILMADFTADSRGTSYTYKDGSWVDMYGMGYGNASIRVGIDGAPALTDLMLKPFNADGYYKAGQGYEFAGQLLNCGNTAVNSFALTVNGATTTIDGVDIKPCETYDFTLPSWQTDREGAMQLDIAVDKVNGGDDSDPSDNRFTDNIFLYPADMERTLLVEGFTGQACSNCPAGHAVVSQFVHDSPTPCIEVMHHAGYQPDYFTTEADVDYTYFYGSSSTYAPAVMVNRTTVTGTVPVMNTTKGNLETARALIERTQPYVSLSLASDYDNETHEVAVKLNILTHNDLPQTTTVFNLLLVQDKLVSRQALGGDSYEHNDVLRRVLTGNSWGIAITSEDALKAGGRYTWATTFTLSEAIVSDYEGSKIDESLRTWPTVAEDMAIVAYVAAYDGGSPSGNQVYNAVKVPLAGGNHAQGGYQSSVETPQANASTPLYRLDGTRMTDSDRVPAGVYIQGRRKIVIR